MQIARGPLMHFRFDRVIWSFSINPYSFSCFEIAERARLTQGHDRKIRSPG